MAPFQWPHCQWLHLLKLTLIVLPVLLPSPTIIRLDNPTKQACKFPAAHTVVHFVLLLPSWGPSENARWTPVAPFPRPVFHIYTFRNCVLLKLILIFGQYAYDNPTGNCKASLYVSCRTYCCAFCAPPSLWGGPSEMLDGLSLVSIRECSMDASGPISLSCVRDIHFSELRFVEADMVFLLVRPRQFDWKSDHTRKASM